MSELFDHCQTHADVWLAVYDLTCWCHPAQGGDATEYAIICAAAKSRLGDAWPWADDVLPPVFDVYCMSKGLPNPFGSSIASFGQEEEGSSSTLSSSLPSIRSYDPDDDRLAAWWVPRWGRILYVDTAVGLDDGDQLGPKRTKNVLDGSFDGCDHIGRMV